MTGDPRLPGVARVDELLTERLATALTAKDDNYRPRTEHLEPDGRPLFTNRLILETSPYLLQHAHNPVNWFAWGAEAFDRARAENKPVLLSVGYSTCHWCHVMERESFEDLEIARFINEHFIPIKVDREERPDVDDIYMRAVQMLTGRGGWPMTVALTPDREPFFGGTYFPPRDGARGARLGFLSILEELSERYAQDRESVIADARSLSSHIRASSAPARPGSVPGPRTLALAARQLAPRFDSRFGGFGGAPKFPQPSMLAFLARYHRRTGDPHAKRMVVATLEGMARGGMYDQVGGGFHRYSTDARWLVPHFEKMLYDNAQLAVAYLEGYQLTGDDEMARVAREILDHVAREMTDPRGGFYSATDADSDNPEGHSEEGWFFTWTPAEIGQVLDAASAQLVRTYYGVTEGGNFEGRNIFHVQRPTADVARDLGLAPGELRARLDSARQQLWLARATRPAPLRDDKIITAWNGLMISAFARGAFVLKNPGYARRAAEAARFVLSHVSDDNGRLLRVHAGGSGRHQAVLDDYAFMIGALLDLHEATSELPWLEQAKALQALQDRLFADQEHGGYFMTASDGEQLMVRDRPSWDGALPSGNSVSAMNLVRLAALTEDETYRERAERLFSTFAQGLSEAPSGANALLCALDYYLDRPIEIVLVRPDAQSADALLAPLRLAFVPNRALTVVLESELAEQARTVPWLEGKVAVAGMTTAYVCESGRCELPTSDPAVFARQLATVRSPMTPPPLGP